MRCTRRRGRELRVSHLEGNALLMMKEGHINALGLLRSDNRRPDVTCKSTARFLRGAYNWAPSPPVGERYPVPRGGGPGPRGRRGQRGTTPRDRLRGLPWLAPPRAPGHRPGLSRG